MNGVSSNDRGYLYGDGLFETVRVRDNGTIRWLDDHIERLERSGAAFDYPEKQIERAVRKLRSLRDRKPGLWRVTVTRPGDEVPFGGTGSVTVRHRPYEPPKRPTLVCLRGFYNPADWLAEHKTTSFLQYAEARRIAQKKGYDDALLASKAGRIGEATSANIVAIIDDQPYTPPVEGILPGITRSKVIEWSRTQSNAIVERRLAISDLKRADEIALLSSGTGVIAAASLDGKKLGAQWSNKCRKWLRKLATGAQK